MKIILHGATNGSNFGDYLFADIFWNKLRECNKLGENIFFEFPYFGIRDFYRKELGYNYKQKIWDLFNSDILIYFSGGYFGERTNTLKESIIRFIRYMPIGLLFILRKKTIMILGVGGGPISNKLLRKVMCMLMDKSIVTTVRDEETANYFKKYGVNKNIIITTDTAQSITRERIPELEKNISEDLKRIFKNKKIVFLHVYGSDNIDNKMLNKIIDPLNSFLKENKDYGVILGQDSMGKRPIEDNIISHNINCNRVYYYNYNHPWQLCALLDKVDLIITPKLHVGIIGATLSKSVISFPMHKEKTLRYYKQIGEIERCIPLDEASYDNIKNVLNKYHNKKINLSQDIIKAANYNLDIIEEIIQLLNKR